MSVPFRSALASALLLAPTLVGAQHARVTADDYARAEQLLPWNASRLVTGDEVAPTFLKDGNRFWYRNKTRSGAEYVLVDPVSNTRSLLFDHARLAATMSLAADTTYDPDRLPFRAFRFGADGDDERTIEFRTGKRQFACDIVTYNCVAKDTTYNEAPFVLSPDKKLEVFVQGHDLYVRPRGGKGDTVRLTTDGVEYFAYGVTAITPQQQLRGNRTRRPNVRWSPDSKKLLVVRTDQRNVGLMPYVSYTSQRPRLFTQPYALPGDSIVPTPHYYVIDVPTKRSTKVELPVRFNIASIGGSLRDSTWTPTSDKAYISGLARASKAAYLVEVDATTGKGTLIAKDTGKTYVELASPRDPESWYVLKSGEVIWWSERDGYGHLWLLGKDGSVKRQITSGTWQVGAVQHVDEGTRSVWFTARGRETDQLVYNTHLYRTGLDGGAIQRLTPDTLNHDITVSPSGRFVVDRASAIHVAPVTVLRDAATGRVLRTLEKADVSQLVAQGWKRAVPFTVKARDGLTDIHGVMYLPAKLDSARRYPIISHIYPGPQVGSVGAWSFKSSGEPFALAELGFVVVQIDHLGTPGRSKAFHDNYYGNFTDNGLPDHIAAIKQLGARHAFIDLSRVGIFGHSGGGFASTDALLRYPEFFSVAVSGAGNHDNRSYNIYWAEKYQGLLRRDSTRRGEDNFTASANKTYAANLRGKLLLMHGDMDDNVHPAMTIQVVDELIKANRDFDLIMAPNRAHGLNEAYFIRRRWDYFVQHLAMAIPPDSYKMTPAAGQGGFSTDDGPDANELWNRGAFDELLVPVITPY
ncbi:DPP IV N-terminal domain-containing protein [Gemmatimonas sp.]|uniref:S9 family peptidase n=1 Tax=Gemmatimonas sp. TaxID=1962908 RepID=UPI0022C7D38A|nr:DPP IV N-terminal domain-containing protein [Gemmatimonas sp.]MCZ8206387.1 DPP IV N-terminal domain-containing protein [Gemmatimonas sp.]